MKSPTLRRDEPKVICVVGRGYWNFNIKDKAWHYLLATETFDEVLILLSQTVNTLMPRPFTNNRPKPLFGDYLRPADQDDEESEIDT